MKNKKKLIIIGIIVAICLALVMCNGSDSDSDPSSNPGAGTTTTPTNQSPSEDITIQETVWVDRDGFKVVIKSIQKSFFGYNLKVSIENNSSENIGISVDDIIINDCIFSCVFAESVAAGKKANAEIEIRSSDLKQANISTVGKIEILSHLYNPDTYVSVGDCDPLTIKTSAFDKIGARDDSGKVLYNENGFKVISKGITKDSMGGDCVLLYIENNNDKTYGASLEYIAVNGYMLSSLFSETVYSGKYTVATLDIYSHLLEENGITAIENVAFELSFYNSKTYQTFAKTGEVVVTK